MASIITGKDQLFGAWAATRIKHIGRVENLGKFVALGIATGTTADDKLLGVCVFHDYYPDYGHCQVSFASADPRWASRQTVRALLAVPFFQYRCHTVRLSVAQSDERTVRLVKALGFKFEAYLKDYFGRGATAVIHRMSYSHYERLYWRKTEQAKAAA